MAVAQRMYARALFQAARDAGRVDAVSADLAALAGATLLGRKPDEVAHELVPTGGELCEHLGLSSRLDLGVA